jgi:hypothetical protein
MNLNFKLILLILILEFYFNAELNAQYHIRSGAFSAGGIIASDSSDLRLYAVTGQNLIGISVEDSLILKSGFLYSAQPMMTAISRQNSIWPYSFELYQNFPNPFNPVTKIKFSLPEPAKVKIEIYNILGQHIITLLNSNKDAGIHTVLFNAGQYPSGLYFYTIQANHFQTVKKMMLIK